MCDSSSSPHFSSLIFFNYPNSSDINFDINKTIQNDVVLNFEKSLVIENNIFGYEFKGTKILNYSNGIILLKNGNNLEIGTIIDSGENIQFKFRMDDFYLKGNYIIEFVYVLTEPDYEKFNHKAENIYQIYGNDKEDEEEYFTKNEYTGKTSNFIVTISQNLKLNAKKFFVHYVIQIMPKNVYHVYMIIILMKIPKVKYALIMHQIYFHILIMKNL